VLLIGEWNTGCIFIEDLEDEETSSHNECQSAGFGDLESSGSLPFYHLQLFISLDVLDQRQL
jgi:hypothetical protein